MHRTDAEMVKINAPSMSFFHKIRSSDTFILTSICFALFTDEFIYGVVVPIIPYLLLDSAHIDRDALQGWTSILLAAYGLSFFIGCPIVGIFTDRSDSRKLPLILGFLALALSTALFFVGHNPAIFVIARLFQGLSGAVVGVLGLALIAETADKHNIGRYMACGSLSLTWGMFCGPIIGGVLFSKLGRLGSFGIPILTLIIDIILRLLMIEKKKTAEESNPREERAVNTAAVYSSFATPERATEGSPLLQRESNAGSKALTFRDFLNPRLLSSMFLVAILSSILSAFETTLPLFTMETFHWSSTGAGLVFIPLSLPSLFGIVIGHYYSSFNPRILASSGFFLAVPPIIALRCIAVDDSFHQILLALLLFLIGSCIMIEHAVTMTEVSHAVDEIESRLGVTGTGGSGLGRGYAFTNMAFASGQFIGPLLAGVSKSGLGWGGMTFILGALSFVAGVSAFLFTGGFIGHGGDQIDSSDEAIVYSSSGASA